MASQGNSEDVRLAKEALLGRLLPNLIHQLRNPLNSILTSAELLSERGDDPNLRRTLLPVAVRSANCIRDLLRSMDSSLDVHVERSFELREALANAKEVLQIRRHTIAIHGLAPGDDIVIAGEYEPLWVLLLSVLEEILCAAKNTVWIELSQSETHTEVSLTHDGEAKEGNPTFAREFILTLVPVVDGVFHCDALAKKTVLGFPNSPIAEI